MVCTAETQTVKPKPDFILCVGAQKAGTTWLHAYVDQFEDTDFGFRKEYHIWSTKWMLANGIETDAVSYWRHVWDWRSRIVPWPNKQRVIRKMMFEVPGVYERYFASLVKNQIRRTGDFTPAYSVLPPEEFQKLKRRIESVGFNLKVVFLMRDPVERVWSAVRMQKREGSLTGDDETLILKRLHTDGFQLRGNYPRTIQSLESCFSPNQLYFGFYENLFEPEQIENIASFLDVPVRLESTKKRVNVSEKTQNLSDDVVKILRAEYAFVYDYVLDRFPVARTLWAHA